MGIGTPVTAETSTRLPGIQRTVELADPSLRALRARMTSGAPMRGTDLRRLADAGDGLAAWKYGQLLAETDAARLRPDIIHYYTIAVHTGRDFAMRRLLAAYRSEGAPLPPARADAMLRAFRFQAARGDAFAADFLARAYDAGGELNAADPDEASRYALRAAELGDAGVAVELAMRALTAGDTARGRSYLAAVQSSPDLGRATMAQNLLAGLPAPQTPSTPALALNTLAPSAPDSPIEEN